MTTSAERIRQEVKTAFDGWTAAIENGDMEGYLAAYHDSAQTRYVNNAKIVRGFDNIAAMFRQRFPSAQDMQMLGMPVLEIEPMGERDALIFGVVQFVEGGEERESVFTVHARKFDGEWRILSDFTASG